jgi:hypothetical protein
MVLASSPLLFSPLALGGWAMMLDCWFLPESPWKKAQHRRRAVSVSVRTAASSWEPSKQSLEPAKAQYSVDEHAPLAMVALWCCAGCFFHQPWNEGTWFNNIPADRSCVADWQFDMFNSPNRAVNLLPPLRIPGAKICLCDGSSKEIVKIAAPIGVSRTRWGSPWPNYRFVCYERVEWLGAICSMYRQYRSIDPVFLLFSSCGPMIAAFWLDLVPS